MSYEKTTWNKGDIITAEKLNKMEEGIEQGVNIPMIQFVVNWNEQDAEQIGYLCACDKTFSEIIDFMGNGVVNFFINLGESIENAYSYYPASNSVLIHFISGYISWYDDQQPIYVTNQT